MNLVNSNSNSNSSQSIDEPHYRFSSTTVVEQGKMIKEENGYSQSTQDKLFK